MDEEISPVVNFDLNLGPGPEVESEAFSSQLVNSNDLITEPVERINEASFRIRDVNNWRLQQFENPYEAHGLSVELNELMGNSGNGGTLLPGEGSGAAEERASELPKTWQRNSGIFEDTVSMIDGDVEKGIGDNGSFFDCNICLELAMDPVVSTCGHLFCWPCLYRRLHVHSDVMNCPVCKDKITIKNVTPIYGRGSHTRKAEVDSSLQIPLRPQARRVESFRQIIYRNPFSFPLEEIVRRLGSRFNLTRDLNLPQDLNDSHETEDGINSFPDTIIALGGMQPDQIPSASLGDIVEITHSGTSIPEAIQTPRLRSLLLRRSQSLAQRHTSLSSTFSRAERLLEAFLRSHHIGRNQEQSQTVDDRNSFSSIAAVINSESQMDTTVEIDSMGSISTSSSRRNDALRLRVRDVESGDSRAPRRRRLN